MEQRKCLLCLKNLTNDKSFSVSEEIKGLYFDLSSMTLDAGECEEICEMCHKNLEISVCFKKFVEGNREEMEKYLADKRATQDLQVNIKVEEVCAEDYEILEYISNPDEEEHCDFCKSSDPLGMMGQKMPQSTFICPSCGRTQTKKMDFECHLCHKIVNTISQFRIHFMLSHARDIKIKCSACEAFFLNEKARNFHGQITHCLTCRLRCMRDKSLMIPFEDHEKNCKNNTVKESSIVVMRPDKINRNHENQLQPPKKPNITVKLTKGSCDLCHSTIGDQKPAVRGIFYSCCPSCGLTIPNASPKPVTCCFCPYTATKISQIRLHVMIHHEKSKKLVRCLQCSLTFYSKSALHSHMHVCRKGKKDSDLQPVLLHETARQKVNYTSFQCGACSSTFDSKLELSYHMNLCGKKKDAPKTVFRIINIPPRKPRQQTVIPLASTPRTVGSTTRSLTSAIPVAKDSESFNAILPDIVENEEEPEVPAPPEFTCSICQLPSNRATNFNLENQMYTACGGCGRQVHGQSRKKCDICDRTFSLKMLMVHYKTTHADVKPIIVCPIDNCDRNFLSHEAMERHKTYHVLTNHRAMKTHRETCSMECDLEQVTVEELVESPKKKGKTSNQVVEKDPFEDTQVGESLQMLECDESMIKSEEEGSVEPAQKKRKIETKTQKNAKKLKIPAKLDETQLRDLDPLIFDESGDFENCDSKSIKPTTSQKSTKPPTSKAKKPIAKAKAKVVEKCTVCESQPAPKPGENATNCPSCSRSIQFTENLKMKLEKFKCSLCSYKTFDSADIRKHISTEHSRSKVVFQCNLCFVTLDSEASLKDHVAKNHSFTCSICTTSKKFLRKEALEEHMKKHNGEKQQEIDENAEIFEII